MQYRTILADPPWPQKNLGKWKKHKNADSLPYPTMEIEEIKALPVGDYAAKDSHLWLWTTNQFLPETFNIMKAWGFKYLSPLVWVKPSGVGAWFVSRTEFLLFGYRGKCDFVKRFEPNVIFANRSQPHSKKPDSSYELIERVSYPDRLELFARQRRTGWHCWGNEVDSDIDLNTR